MKNYIKILIVSILTLFASSAFAFTAPPPPTNGTFVLDLANKLSPDQLATLNQKIEGIKGASKNEFGVLILQSMGGESIEDVAYTTFNSWGVGHKGLDNGVLIVIAATERKTRIETGKGVGELTDLQCNDILQNTLRPFLKKGDYFGGLNATIDAANGAVDSRKNAIVPPASNNSPAESDNFGLTLIVAFVGLLVFGVIGFFIVAFFVNRSEEERKRSEQAYDDQLEWERKIKNTTTEPLVKKPYKTSTAIAIGVGAVAAVGGTAIAISLEEADRKRRREQERRDEEDRVRRRSEEDDRSSSYSGSSSGSDSGSWGGGSDSGFGGGSDGGGGSSSDF